jgi:hypothetical protein
MRLMPDLTMSRGDSLVYATTLYQLNQPVKIPQDLTGAKVWFTAKRYFTDPDNQAVSQVDSVGGGVVIVNPPVSGQIVVTLPFQATVGFPDSDVVLIYDIQIRTSGGLVLTLERGTLTVSPDATRATA